MGREQFQVRVEDKTQDLINIYECYLNTITGMFINSGDINRAVVEEGIRSLIEKKGGLEYINKVIDKEANEIYTEVIKEDRKNK